MSSQLFHTCFVPGGRHSLLFDRKLGGPIAGLDGLIIIIITAIGLLPCGSGYFTCIQNMKLVTTKFKSGGLHEKHVMAIWRLWNHLSICL